MIKVDKQELSFARSLVGEDRLETSEFYFLSEKHEAAYRGIMESAATTLQSVRTAYASFGDKIDFLQGIVDKKDLEIKELLTRINELERRAAVAEAEVVHISRRCVDSERLNEDLLRELDTYSTFTCACGGSSFILPNIYRKA